MSDGARVTVALLCLVVFVGAGGVVWGQSTASPGIDEVSVTGGGVISPTEAGNDSTYVWQSESVNVSASVVDYPEASNYGVCLGYEREGAPPKRLVSQCDPLALSDGTNGTAEFANVTWPSNTTGEQELVVELRNQSIESNATVLDRKTVPVTVLRKQGDWDGDGLTNAAEVERGYNLSNSDMDSDGLDDGAEINQYDSNPQNPDSDGDGIRDGVEIQRGTDPAAADTDGDGLGDRIESTLRTNPTSEWTPVWLVLGVVVLLGVALFATTRLRRRWRERGGDAAAASGDSDGTATNDPADGPETVAEPTPEPLTDEDRVLSLLRRHGGRMKQSQIVAETEWSKAKVSRLLSAMTEDGAIDKLSIGRENIISLDGQQPEAARPSHEENASD